MQIDNKFIDYVSIVNEYHKLRDSMTPLFNTIGKHAMEIFEKMNRNKLSVNKLIKIIEDDNGDNYDCRDYNNIEDVIESLSDIYGINNLKQVE